VPLDPPPPPVPPVDEAVSSSPHPAAAIETAIETAASHTRQRITSLLRFHDRQPSYRFTVSAVERKA
jgi:hypothetical protein